MEFLRRHWEKTLFDNKDLIINNSMQIVMAEEVIKMCKRELKKFPAEKKPKKILPIQKA